MSFLRSALAAFVLAGFSFVVHAQDGIRLKIIDQDGAATTVFGLDIDYSNYPGGFGMYQPDHEMHGIRIRQGKSKTTVNWQNITSLTILPEPIYFVGVKCDDPEQEFSASDKAKWEELKKGACRSRQEYKLSGLLQLASGQSLTVELVPPSRELKGPSELGAFSIGLSDVRKIEPVLLAK